MSTRLTSIEVADEVLQHCAAKDFAGADPFDMLNSQLFQKTPLKNYGLPRLALIQLGKRLPISFRRLLQVPELRNPKGVALFVMGLLEDFKRTKSPEKLATATSLGKWIETQKCDPAKWNHACWGYHFDWQARSFYVPKGTPNIITTYYCAQALYALGEQTGESQFIETALDSAKFMNRSLLRKALNGAYFTYIPGESSFVHNANLWGAAWTAFAGQKLGDTLLIEAGLEAANTSVAEQHENGAWIYGTDPHHGFIDSFHTGYNLEALHLINTNVTPEFEATVSKGLKYYVDTFIEADGQIKYYNNSLHPLDVHCYAQALITLLVVGGPSFLTTAQSVANSLVHNLYLPNQNRFAYQKGRMIFNKVDYTRWTQAWAFLSLALLNRMEAIDEPS
jgi:polysaccharide biosynthesis protein VpsJ